MIVFERLARRGTAKDSFDIVEFGGLDEGLDDRRTAAPRRRNQQKIILAAERDWPNGALGGIVAHFDAVIAGKARQEGRQAFFHCGFFGAAFLSRHGSEPNPACPHGRDEDGRTTPPPQPRPHLPDHNSKPGASQRSTSAMLMRRT